MTWRGPILDEDQQDLLRMLDDLAGDRDLTLTDDPAVVGSLVAELAELGLWTVGATEAHGGGGADRTSTGLVAERLGRAWPALGWASVQAHAATDLLGGVDGAPDVVTALVSDLHAGRAAVAVVDGRSSQVRLDVGEEVVAGSVDRVDAASERPHLLVLLDEDRAVLVEPDAVATLPVRRTGLGGALTRSLEVDARTGSRAHVLTGVDTTSARTTLLLGAASVAAGIAGAAADAAATYAAARVQFGAPLTALPTVRRSLLDQDTLVTAATVAALGVPTVPTAATAAARTACEHAITVAAAALQSHGGYGYLTEYPAERHLRDAISIRAAADLVNAEQQTGLVLAGLDPDPALAKEAS